MERANTRETSALIKRYIKEKYNVCAKVRTSKYSGGDSLDIEYTAGPDEGIIKPLFNNLQEGDFDGMIDLYEYRDKSGLSLYGKELETRKYVFVRQEIPAPLYFALAKCYSDANNFAGIPKLETPEQLYKNDPAFEKWAGGCWTWQHFFDRAFEDRNFCTDETDKIKIISCEDDPDKNRAVIFTYEYEGKRYKTNKFELPGKPAKAAKPDPEPVAGSLKIIEYSEKALAVIGDTRPIKDTLKQLGGRFNPRLTCGPGWIFSKKRENELKQFIN